MIDTEEMFEKNQNKPPLCKKELKNGYKLPTRKKEKS